jgi:hypothetical protein
MRIPASHFGMIYVVGQNACQQEHKVTSQLVDWLSKYHPSQFALQQHNKGTALDTTPLQPTIFKFLTALKALSERIPMLKQLPIDEWLTVQRKYPEALPFVSYTLQPSTNNGAIPMDIEEELAKAMQGNTKLAETLGEHGLVFCHY